MAGFAWKVAVNGYEWQTRHETRTEDQTRLVPVSWEFRTYHPLVEHTGLFRDFASTSPTPEGIRAFANQYGHLGEGGGWQGYGPSKGPERFASDEEREEFEREVSTPQQLEEWQRSIRAMQDAITTWKHVQKTHDQMGTILLVSIVDRHLYERRIVARLAITSDHQPALQLMPSTLLGAMWLQFAQAIDGHKDYRACRTCRRYFELSPKHARTSRYYCSEACRSAAYRARMERARQLHAMGMTIRQIAIDLKSDTKTVKKWVAKTKE